MRSTSLILIHSCILTFIFTSESFQLVSHATSNSIPRSLIRDPLPGKRFKRGLSSDVAELPETVESLEKLSLKGVQLSDKHAHGTQSRYTSSSSSGSVESARAPEALLDWHPTNNFPDPSAHFNAMNDHRCITLHAYAYEGTRRPTVSELFSTSKGHVDPEDATLVPYVPATLEVTLRDIMDSGAEMWYKNQKVLNSWKQIGLGPAHKELLIIVGEAVQIWSKDFLKTMKKWSPDFRTIWPSLPIKTVPGATKLTQSTPLKNLEMLSRAMSSVDPKIKEKVYAWYRRVMGGKEFDNRVLFLKDNHNKIGEKIVDALSDSFSKLLDSRDSLLSHITLLEEVADVYPEIREQFLARIQALHPPNKFVNIAIHSDIAANSIETYDFIEKSLKRSEDWPFWSYDEAVDLRNRQPSFSQAVYQEVMKDPFVKIRLSRIESYKDGLVSKLVGVMRKLLQEDKSKSVFLELQWLSEILTKLNLEDRTAVHEDVQFILALEQHKYYNTFLKGCFEARTFASQELEDIFKRTRFTSSEALEALFTIQLMKLAPDFYNAEALRVRKGMKTKPLLDFDQKYEWLQELSQSAAVNMLVANYKNFISFSEKPSFSSITGLEQHLILENFDSMYENNPKLSSDMYSKVNNIFGETSLMKSAKVIQSSLRQVWTRDTWNSFLEGKLGYSEKDSIYHEIYKLGKAIQLEKEWPSFSEDEAKSAYMTYKATDVEVKQTFHEILGAEFNERVRLVLFAARREEDLSPHRGSSIDINELISADQVSRWSRQGLTASAMIQLVNALGLGNKNYVAGESWLIMDSEDLLPWIDFFETPDGRNSIHIKELSRLFGGTSPNEIETRLSQLREHINHQMLPPHT